MTRWEEMMTHYRYSHRNPVNVAIHVVLVPVIVCAVLVAAGWARTEVLGLTVSGAWLAVAASILFYFSLDAVLAAAFVPLVLGLAWVADRVATLPWQRSATLAAIGFFGGFAVQFLGHAVEGRRPALLKSPWLGPLTAPLFVVAEVVRPLGVRRDLWQRVDAEIARREQVGG